MNTSDVQLIATSCTTGWGDWIHGALWIHPNGLVRTRLGLAQTRERTRGLRGLPPQGGPTPTVTTVDISHPELILAAHKTNKVIEFSNIAAARLHRGKRTDRLNIRMADGVNHKLLWLPQESASDILQRDLPGHLGKRFEID
jgi:hypothetical protein